MMWKMVTRKVSIPICLWVEITVDYMNEGEREKT